MSDLIERQAAIEKIEELQMPIMRSASLIDQCKFDGLGMAREVLIDLPPVTPEQKVGKWIFKKGHYFPFCSECDTWIDVEQGTMEYNYCMNCGAKMENVKELGE